jgi:hypothetical protein
LQTGSPVGEPPRPRPKGEAKEEEESKILEGDRGVASLTSEPAPPATTAADPPCSAEATQGGPTPEHIAYVDAAVERATAALRGDVPKGIRDPAPYGAAIKDAKFNNLVKAVNAWVGTGLDGEALWAAWEVLAAAEKAETREAMTPAGRKHLNKIVEMYRASSAGMEATA